MPFTHKTIINTELCINAIISKDSVYNKQDRIWHSGHWYKGLWCDGNWLNGIWYDGIWYYGIWHIRAWEDSMITPSGYWHEGRWYGGVWLNGSWKSGIITNYNRKLMETINTSPKSHYKPNKTVALNYAKYQNY